MQGKKDYLEKRFNITASRVEYESAIKRLKTPLDKRMKGKRQSTVEPVFGTLTQFLGLRKVNACGIANASKVMLASAMPYNLKKYLKYTQKHGQEMKRTVALSWATILGAIRANQLKYPSP